MVWPHTYQAHSNMPLSPPNTEILTIVQVPKIATNSHTHALTHILNK